MVFGIVLFALCGYCSVSMAKSLCFLNLRKIPSHQPHLSSDCIGDAAVAAVAAVVIVPCGDGRRDDGQRSIIQGWVTCHDLLRI